MTVPKKAGDLAALAKEHGWTVEVEESEEEITVNWNDGSSYTKQSPVIAVLGVKEQHDRMAFRAAWIRNPSTKKWLATSDSNSVYLDRDPVDEVEALAANRWGALLGTLWTMKTFSGLKWLIAHEDPASVMQGWS